MHWDAEWHWDAIYNQYPHQALGGHVVALGLSEAHQIWEEYTYPIFNWAHQQNGIAGFAHMEYLDNNIPQSLTCCTPIEYPVEVALGASDFISEDVVDTNNTGSGLDPESAIQAYYRLLNCGFRPGLAAGTDYPCNDARPLGSLLTYVQVAGGQMTYRNWIEGIAGGRTVVSRNGHNEFLDLKVNGSSAPGDEIKLTGAGTVQVNIQWIANQNLSGTIELVQNGIVVASRQASVAAGAPASLSTTVDFAKSGWLAARRMGSNGHQVHTGAVFVTVNNAPVRASVADAEFYVQWMDNLLEKTSPGGAWSSYFVNSRSAAQARYQSAKAMYQQIASEAAMQLTISTTSLPDGALNVSYLSTLTASGGTLPYTWSIASGSLPTGLSLNSSTGAISGISTAAGTFSFTARVTDSGNPIQTATGTLSITVAAQASSTIWPATTVPGVVDSGPDSAVELGVKFRSDTNGNIIGIRFYKASTNTGTHVGNLWTAGGTRLATATFASETASGWQQVNFSSPVAITANTVYVASYHTNAGHYSDDQNYFAGKGVDSPPLHALADGVSGFNGVYAYGSTSSFPNLGWNSSNYWVDVALSTTTSPDTTPPTVTAFTVPANATSLTVTITSFTAMDNVAVTGYLVTNRHTPLHQQPPDGRRLPDFLHLYDGGNKTLYAWAKDAAGNVSASRSASVVITLSDTTPPTVTVFTIPATATALTVPITSFTATDNVGVTGYLVNESPTAPAPTAAGWSTTVPTSYTCTTAGNKTLYAWAKDAAGNVSASRSASVVITLSDVTPPSAPANLSAIAGGPTQVSLNWTASTDNVGVTGYRVMRNGSQIATSSSTAYSDTTVAAGTAYSYTVRAYDAAGNVSADSNTASVTTPTLLPAPVLDVTVTTRQSAGSRTISSPSFSTAKPNELLVAFIASDGPNTGGAQLITAVTGGGLTWTLRSRANAQAGTAEIWQARATNVVSNVIVTATRATGSYQGMITVAAFQGASLVANGSSTNASAASGAPTVSFVTTKANSVVWGVGDDWDRAVTRTVSPNQTKLSEYLAPAGDTFWVQYITAPVAMAGVSATISCTAPTNDRWNLAAIEIVPQ